MSSRIRGITIELNGDTTQLQDSIRDVEKRSNGLAKELKDVEKLLKMNPGNIELIAQRQQLLTDRISATTEKLDALKAAQAQVEQQFQSGQIGEEAYRRFQREIITTEGSLNGLRNQLQRLTDEQQAVQQSTRQLETLFQATGTSIDDFADALGSNLTNAIRNGTASSQQLEQALSEIGRQALGAEADLDRMRDTLRSVDSGNSLDGIGQDLLEIERDAGRAERGVGRLVDSLKDIGQNIGIAGAGIGGATLGLVEGFDEQNRAFARLKTNTTIAGQDYDLIKEKVQELGGITGDTTKEVETLSNLQATGLNGDQLVSMVDEIAAAYIKYSDTLSTEGIADGFQETIALGEATGSFLELLEREGANVDDFNDRMANAKTEAEKSTIAYDEFVKLGLKPTLDEYRNANPEIDKHAEAQAKMKDALGELSIALTPLVTKITEFITKIVEWVVENEKLAVIFVVISTAIGALVGVISALAPVIGLIITNFNLIRTVLMALTGPIGVLIGIIVGLAIAIIQNWDTVSAKTKEIWDAVVSFLKTAFDTIKTTATNVFNSIKDFFTNIFENYKTIISTAWETIKTLVKNAATNVRDSVKNAFSNLYDSIKSTLDNARSIVSSVWDTIKTKVQSAANGARDAAKNAFSNLYDGIRNTMNNVKTTVSNIWDNVMSFLRGINLYNIGRDMISGLINGIKGMTSRAIGAITGVVDGVVNKAKSLLKIKSPSRVFMEIGEFTNEGFVKGIEDTSAQISKTMDNVYGNLGANAMKMASVNASSAPTTNNNVTNSMPIHISLNYNGNGSEADALRMAKILDNQLGNLQRSRLRMSGVRS